MGLPEANHKNLSFRAAEVGQVLCKALMQDKELSQKKVNREKDLLDEKTNALAGLIGRQKWLPFICSAVAGGSKLLASASLANNIEKGILEAMATRVAPDLKETGTYHMEGKKTVASSLVEKIKTQRDEHAQSAAKADGAFSKVMDDLSSVLRFLGYSKTS